MRARRALHEEEFAVRSVGIALHDHGAVGEMRQEEARDFGVVFEQISFGDAELGPEGFFEIGEAYAFSADFDFGFFLIAHNEPPEWRPVRFSLPAHNEPPEWRPVRFFL